MKSASVHAQRAQFPVRVLCRVRDVSESGDHSWRTRPQQRQEDDARLLARINQSHEDSKGRYGAPRIHADLKAQGVPCSRRRVARLASRRLETLMRAAGLRGTGKRKDKTTTDANHAFPVAENLVQREFDVAEPNKVWAADITYISTKEGWLYLAVVLDLHSRLVMGRAMGKRMTTALPLSALSMAFHGRRPLPDLVHHSDRGSPYASGADQRALHALNMTCSMSNKGDCCDNAVVESNFSDPQQGTGRGSVVRDTPGGSVGAVRVSGGVLQQKAPPLVAGRPQPNRVRGPRGCRGAACR